MEKKHAWADLEYISGIPSEELFERLLNDTIFVDYLNTFLSLPVFGKRFCYNRADDKFSIEPSPPRTYYHLPRNFVKEWIRKERLKFFCKTDLFLQYLLYAYLQEGCESSNTSMDRYQFRWYLGTVESMRSFQRFLLGTMGQRILFFWIDAERFRRVTKKEHRRFAFRDIQSKYLQSGSPWELPEIMKWASLCGVSDDLGKRSSFKFPKSVLNRMYLCDASIFAENVFVCGQKMAVDRLVCYWVPKFIQRKKKIRGILEEKRLRQSLCGSQTITLKPVSEVVPEITVTKNASQEEIDIFMDAHCVSSTESVEEKDDEIRARRLEEWKRWFWEGVDEDIQSENEKVVELPEYVPEELRQLGGIKEFSSSCFVTPEKGKASVDVGGDQNVSQSPREMDGSPKDKIYSRSPCSPPKSLPSSPKEGSLSEPKFSTTSLLEWYQWHENIHIKPRNLKQENQHESEEAKRVNLPRLPQPYALLPTTTHRKPKTQYEALASKQRTDQGTKELRKLPPKRSTSASPPQTAILALERASVSHVIPFREVGNEIAAIIGEPRNAYPTESPLPEQLSRMGESSRAGLFSDIYFTDESASLALMVLTGDKLAGGPLREYLEKTRNKKALRSLQFWEDAQRYLSPADDFGSFNKFHMAKTLVATYIAPDSPRQLPISRSIRDDLMRLLPGEKGDHLLTSVVDECIQEVVSPWSEYVRSDEDHFISSVAMRRKVGSELTNVKAAKMWTKVRALKERKAFFPEDTGSKFRALALAARLGVNAIVGSDDVDNEEAEALNDEFKIPSLKDHEKEREELSARNKGIPHFYGQTFKKGEDTAEATKKTAPTKMKTPKPRSFADILFEPVQLNGFKKFLAEKNAEAPMAFWQAVENMKTNCKDGKARLARAATIVRKFFINIPTSAVEYLNCKADIIRDIPTLDKVTPPMLISAQACVSRSIEENWFSEYIATFPEDENEGESFASYAMRDTLAGVFKMTGHGKTIGLWRMVAHSITLLLHGIHNPELLEEFKQFLRRETKATIEQNLKRHAPHPARRMVNSKLVSVDRLISDVEFWLEVERFKNLADHAAQCARSGNYTLEDENLLIDKAKAIVRCFIDSDVPPRLQVNIANETAESIVALVKSDIIERGLFHNAAMSVFIPLMFFWKKFSAERISNPAEKVIQSAYSAGANKRPITRGSTHSLICGMPYKRVYMSTDDDIFWSYSLHHGLRLMLPHKFAIAKQDAAQLGRRSTGLSDALSLPRPTP